MADVYGDRWENKGSLGEGGQAHVFKVIDQKGEYHGEYVLKRFINSTRLGRIKTEVEALRNLSHENIVKLIDFDLEDEKPWFVQEYCEGGDLAQYLQQQSPLDIGKAFDIFIDVCKGLSYAHSQDIIHRDIKPKNVFLRGKDGPAVLGDFGLAWIIDGNRVTLSGEAVGSFHYMAPELSDGPVSQLTKKSDVYSLGKLLYFLLSNGKSFDREKYKEQDWNLVHLNDGNLYFQHVNLILDKMIVEDSDDRESVDEILQEGIKRRRLILNEFNLVDGKSTFAPCKYCGIGLYRPKLLNDDDRATFFGIQSTVTVQQDGWRALVCDYCGNVQLFRMDLASNNWFPTK